MTRVQKTLVILASTNDTNQVEKDIQERYDSQYLRFRGVPKGLLPISGRPALSWWYEYAKELFQDIYIVANAYNFKHFERWSTGINFPRENILNSGLSAGAVSDLAFVHRIKEIKTDIVITLPEFVCTSETATPEILDTFTTKSRFIYTTEKHVPFAYGMDLSLLNSLDSLEQEGNKALSDILEPTLTCGNIPLFDYVDPRVTFQSYLDLWSHRLDHTLLDRSKSLSSIQFDPIHIKAYARVGLMGNPSDGFYGKTLSLLISNFWAQVTLLPNNPTEKELEAITILPNPVSDPHKFTSIECLVGVSEIDGYETGDRLLQACCKVFYTYCNKNEIPIETRQGFKMMFETNIPRQVGLAGSSAIITALWKSLCVFYRVNEQQIPLERQASLILEVEQNELGIAAGLQDRVIQTFGGLVYMDFDRDYMNQHGHGKYEKLDISLLPRLWLAYVADPEDSGKVHSNVKQRFLNGDQEIIDAMKKFASFTVEARESLLKHDHTNFAKLMSDNFNLRRQTYGDAVVGAANLRMIELARKYNCAAKFPGSGGAIVGMWNGTESTEKQDLLQLRRALEKEGFVFLELVPKEYDE